MINIPELRFEGFNDEWEQRKLSDIAEIVGGGTPDTNNPEYWDGDIDWFAPAEISDKIYADSSVRRITSLGLQKCSAKMLPADRTILFTSRAGIGKTAILRRSACTNQGFQSLVLKDGIVPYFIYSMSAQLKEKAEAVASGSTFDEISGKMLGNLDIVIPDTSEQAAIGDVFSSFDNLITLHQRNYERLKGLKRAYLQKMFPKEGRDVPELRFEGFSGKWERRKLEEVVNFFKGNGLSWESISENGSTECILYGNLYTDYGMIAETVKYKTDSIINNPIYSEFGDVLIPASDTTPTGLARATCIEKSGVLLGGDINILRPHKGINGSCLSLAINANKKELIKLIKGITVRHIHYSDLKDVVISIPKSNEEQSKIVDVFRSLDHLINLHQSRYERLTKLKKAYLQKMFC